MERTERGGRGLANERTLLAWSRSALSLAAIGALTLRYGAEQHAYLFAYPVAGVALLGAIASWGYANVVYRDRRDADNLGFVAQPRALRAMAITTTLLALSAIAIAILS